MHKFCFGVGYGLTETSPAAMLGARDYCKLGSVGILLPNVEAKVGTVKSATSLLILIQFFGAIMFYGNPKL